MSELREQLQAMLGPLTAEYRSGCLNSAAIGGFDRHLQRLTARALAACDDEETRSHLRRLAEIADAYAGLDLEQRARVLREAKRRLDALLERRPPPPPRAPASLTPVAPPPRPAEPPARRPAEPRSGRVTLETPLTYLKGFGPRRAQLLGRLGLDTLGDLLFWFPRRHEDRSRLTPLGQVRLGETVTCRGTLRFVDHSRPRGGRLSLVKAVVTDGTGSLDLVWFNQPWLADQLEVGREIICSGRVATDRLGRYQLSHPAWELLEEDGEQLHTGRLVPIYRLTEGLPQTSLRRWIKGVVDHYTDLLPEILPARLRASQRPELVGRREAVRSFHFPADEEDRLLARRRLVFEEFFGLQVALAQRRWEYDQRGRGIAFETDSELARRLIASLPFELTAAQRRVIDELLADMAAERPMNRLVQGDVGSGKTLVALTAMLTAVDNGYQAALMVPTELLAEQHHRVLRHWCEPLGVGVDLISGKLGSRQRRESLERLRRGETHLAVGTHALIQETVDFDALGLVVIDEQHRFGVMQRKLLTSKGQTPDVLVMTATPIPRSLALTMYGELEQSTIDELPRGRTPVETFWYPFGRRKEVYREIKERLAEGRQAYVVCPLVEGSEALEDVEAAVDMAAHLAEHFKKFRVGLIHGRLKPTEKDEVMQRFRAGEIDLLAATTVIEVGIDVPNATIMVIVNADRFGLAQLHQLRGRVGRGRHVSQCYLLTDAKYNPDLVDDESGLQYRDARARLRVLRDHADGFRLAEADLELRGPGELGGTRQSGSLDFRVAHLARDGELLQAARDVARELVERDPRLLAPEHAELARYVEQRFRDRGQLAEVG